jgi:hypothetical protein
MKPLNTSRKGFPPKFEPGTVQTQIQKALTPEPSQSVTKLNVCNRFNRRLNLKSLDL